MTRRLVATIVVTVLVTLIVVGASTLIVARWQARETTEQELRRQAESLAAATAMANLDGLGPGAQETVRRVLRQVRRALRVDGVEFVALRNEEVVGQLPVGVELDDRDLDALAAGETVSGHDRRLVFAAAPAAPGRPTTAVAVVTRQADAGLAVVNRWFLVGALFTLALGVATAVLVGRRLARPVRRAGVAARHIAGGDLTTRLPEPEPDAHDELSELARSINAMAAGLERARVLDQQFLLSISHDLRTPLTSIRGYAEAIADGAAPDARHSAEVILAQAVRLQRLVDDLLALARLDARTFSLHVLEHDVREPLEQATRAVAPAVERAGLTLDASVGTQPIVVVADPERVVQILDNLLENATKYASSRIVVTLRQDGAHAVLAVEDDGPGIAADDVAHVFERLYMARHRPVRDEVGSGLGLAIVRQLTEAMGGHVATGASSTGGARLEVRLPLALGAPTPNSPHISVLPSSP